MQFSLLTSYNTHPDSAHEPPSERTISEITFPMIEQRSGALSSSLRGRKDKVLSMSLYPFFASNTMRSFACLCKLTACVSAPAPSVCLCAPAPVQVSGREYDNLAHSCNAFRRTSARPLPRHERLQNSRINAFQRCMYTQDCIRSKPSALSHSDVHLMNHDVQLSDMMCICTNCNRKIIALVSNSRNL